MKEEYRNSFIYKVCNELEINMKELALELGKGLKQIENYRKDENNIPASEKRYMKLLMKTKKLEEVIKSMEKHSFTVNKIISTDAFGSAEINIKINNGDLKRLADYQIVLQEI